MLARIALMLLVVIGCGGPVPVHRSPWDEPDYFEGDTKPAGRATTFDTSRTGLGRVVANLDGSRWSTALAGKAIFQRVWREGPGIGTGLGPLYNASSCTTCHFLDGRGGAPGSVDVPLLARVAGAAVYGGQLSDRAGHGLAPEGTLAVTYTSSPVTLADGTVVDRRRPAYAWTSPGWGAIDARVQLSPRMPAGVAGLGLLEAIDDAAILVAADPDDRDGNQISGRAQRTSDGAVGRFGWKASQPTVAHQVSTALREDMGLTSWLRPESNCTPLQAACRAYDGVEEVTRRDLELVTTYIQLLGVPARRAPAAVEVREGRQVFMALGCAECHTPRHQTGIHPRFPELSHQTIFPYTDLLLHDMGPDLADGVDDHEAAGAEWRTPPLWGLGLLEAIHGRVRLLHDGRARSVEEAVLWHGGEAATSARRYRNATARERAMLVRFVESL
jgi:CxxC motif-containing protein (DUF1111 family)